MAEYSVSLALNVEFLMSARARPRFRGSGSPKARPGFRGRGMHKGTGPQALWEAVAVRTAGPLECGAAGVACAHIGSRGSRV